ncbi:MAG TPA: OmpA family protein [Terriglobales bacterium]|nr:OmpA family protein [Terriglobales bacterium]
MRVFSRILIVLAIALMPVLLLAQDDAPQDAENCKDSAIITRMPGSTIHACENKEFEQVKVPVGKDADGNVTEKTLEGEYHYWDYGTREGVSEIQVFRNFETALKQAGMKIVYEDSPGTIVANKGDTWYWLQNSGSYYYQTILAVKAMQQEVTADASSIADELSKSGHIALYGIHFETGKAAILPDSETVLSEVAKMLQQNPDVKVSIEGHTDNVGNAATNQTLSEKRAQAVVAWLTSHGIDGSRLKAKGWGASKPIEDNGTEDGRAKNRRVELVKIS